MANKFVYLFSEGKGSMRELLGGKGANLAEMTGLGMPVPQGFTISTEACTAYYDDGEKISDEIQSQIETYLQKLEEITDKKFGDNQNPLLVSVRSGSRASMPGMMDTILNLGINDTVAETMSAKTGNPRFVYDAYRRFIQMYSDVVMEQKKEVYERVITDLKKQKGVELDTDLTADDLKGLVAKFKSLYKENQGADFPADPREQLLGAVKAVFRSWNNPRAITYRRMNDIPSSWGTAVNVQSMVFGNTGDTSGTGVAFTRNPSTGENKLYGEFLINAQGEDVVAGIRTPNPISDLENIMPEVYKQFVDITQKLETHYRDMQDMEFTIEEGKLFMLQTRNGKRTPQAALKIAVDLVAENMRSKEEAVAMVEPRNLDALLHPQFDAAALKAANVAAKGLPASPGAACGIAVFTPEKAVTESANSPVLLIRHETTPEDIEGMHAAQGILTSIGGMTSHAAVVARGMGTCCVAGCKEVHVDEVSNTATIAGTKINEGDWVSIDGSTGNVYIGKIETKDAEIGGDFGTFMSWVDECRTLRVRTNADTPADARKAVELGAEGIGLTRTEHMFFEADRIPAIREMIVSETEEQRRRALDKLLPMQRGDFEGIFEAMAGRPVTIRLLDPPLHEFMPHDADDIHKLAQEMKLSYETLKTTIDGLHEFNPMMGHRGCRLSVSYPEIAEMQARAIIEAAINVNKKGGAAVVPEIMIPLVGDPTEFTFVKDIVKKTADETISKAGVSLDYKIGTMIEIPRAALLADEIAAAGAEFFSFGTNDLTQMTYGFSRDDSGKFLQDYYDKKVFESDPFARLDQNGVGKLVQTAAKLGKSARPDIKLGICGEHGGDPSSVEFCHKAGLAYVSCSPFRVPIARLAAAQAAIAEKK